MPDSAKVRKKQPPAAGAKKRRLPIVDVAERTQVGCLTCGLCCTYIAVGIDGPKTPKLATEILWHLYHEGVSVYRDSENEWMVQFEARCRHLAPDNRCAIYEQRPHICRDYSEQSCEVNAEGIGLTFYAPDEFLLYLEKQHKRIYKAICTTYVPSPDLLGRTRRSSRRKEEAFEARFARLRALGAPKPKSKG